MSRERRLWILFGFLAAGFLCLAGRLFALQVVLGDHYEELATRRVRRVEWVTPMRGAIRDRAGKILARDRVVYDLDVTIPDLVYVGSHEALVANIEAAFRATNSRISRRDVCEGLDTAYSRIEEAVQAELRRQGTASRSGPSKRLSARQLAAIQGIPQPFLRDVERDACLFIEANPERYPGIGVKCRYARELPEGDLFAHVVGVTGLLGPFDIARLKADDLFLPALREGYGSQYILTDPYYRQCAYEYSDRIGRTGLERRLETRLRGVRGVSIVERGRRGSVEIATALPLDVDPPQPGEEIMLTVSCEIQREAVTAMGGMAGAAVAMDPVTGEILALVSSPKGQPGGLNKAIRGTPPPASTVKIVTALAGLEEGVISPHTTVECRGKYQAPGVVLGCWTTHGAVDLAGALAHSCNCYFYEVADRLRAPGKTRIAAWMERFGFGRSAGIELADEELGGEVPGREDFLTAIGQGRFQATPLQVVRMTAAVANGGTLVVPHLVRRVGPDAEPPEKVPLSAGSLAAVREGMKQAVTGGTAAGRGLAESDAAGKTGTAQVVSGKVAHAWFTGYAPRTHPRVAVAVFVEEGLAGGGERAAPVAARIIAKALEVLEREKGERGEGRGGKGE